MITYLLITYWKMNPIPLLWHSFSNLMKFTKRMTYAHGTKLIAVAGGIAPVPLKMTGLTEFEDAIRVLLGQSPWNDWRNYSDKEKEHQRTNSLDEIAGPSRITITLLVGLTLRELKGRTDNTCPECIRLLYLYLSSKLHHIPHYGNLTFSRRTDDEEIKRWLTMMLAVPNTSVPAQMKLEISMDPGSTEHLG